MSMVNIAKFISFIIIFFYIPGYCLINYLRKDIAAVDKATLSLCTGIFFVPHIYYFLETFRLHKLFLVLIAVFSILYGMCRLPAFVLAMQKNKIKINLDKTYLFLLGMGLIALLITFFSLGTSGTEHENGMHFYHANAYDSAAQLSMIEELSKEPPHEFPFYSGAPLKGYYVGSFYWRAIAYNVTGIDPVDLFFRYCPCFFLLLIIMAGFCAVRKITGKDNIAIMATFFIFFMSDLSWIYPVIDRLMPFKEITTAGLNGSLLLWSMFNPPLAFGIMLFFILCYFLKSFDGLKEKRKILYLIFLSGIITGSLFEYKAFMWAVLISGLTLAGLTQYLFKKKTLYLKISFISILFSIIPFYRISQGQGSLSSFKLKFACFPVALLNELGFINDTSNVNLFMMIAALVFFIIMVLGLKTIGLKKLYESIKNYKNISTLNSFLVNSMVISFILTNIFSLKSNYSSATYNFFAVFLLIAAIFAAEVIVRWTRNLNISSRRIIFVAIFILGIGSTSFSFLAYFPEYSRYKVVSKDELDAISFLKNNSEKSDVILHNIKPKDWFSLRYNKKVKEGLEARDSFTSALAGRRVVSECQWHMSIFGYASGCAERKSLIEEFFNTDDKDRAKYILAKYNVSYVWVENNNSLKLEHKNMLKKVFSNKNVTIYKVLP